MGCNKALLACEGLPLWQRQYALLNQVGVSECAVSVGAGCSWRPEGVPLVVDRCADAGPLGGIEAALSWCQGTSPAATHLIVLAVDLPRITASWFLSLAQICSIGKGAVGQWHDGGYFEPLAAIYPRELAVEVATALQAGDLSLQHLMAAAVHQGRMAVCEIGPADAALFANWNRPEDLAEGLKG
jgi:molybdenum cofactor guanylyltransferase